MEEKNQNNPHVYSFGLNEVIVVQTIIVFLVVFSAMLITVWLDIVQSNLSEFNLSLFLDILKTAGKYTITFLIGYSISKYLYYKLHRIIEVSIPFITRLNLNKKQIFAIHTYFIASLIMGFSAIRPIIQFPFFSDASGQIEMVGIQFVNYYFKETAIMLVVLYILTIFFLFLWNTSTKKNTLTMISIVLFFFGGIVSLNNIKPTFAAKIYEVRGLHNVLIESTPDPSPHTVIGLDDVYFKTMGEKMVSKSSEALALTKNKKEKAYALYWMSMGYAYIGEKKEALKTILTSIEYDPREYAYGELAYAYIEMKKYKSAIEAAKTCIEIKPDVTCYAPLAKAQWFMGDYEEAEKSARTGLEIFPYSQSLKRELIYQQKYKSKELANMTEAEREARKDNESLNACLATVQEITYKELFERFCLEEGKERYCEVITGEHGQILMAQVSLEKSKCYKTYSLL